VLIADDRRDTLQALRLLLETNGFTVVPAVSPIEALRAAEAHPIDAALVDLNYDAGRTSGDQGFDLISRLRHMHATMPIIAMTAWATPELTREAMRRGARDLVEKPWEETRLVATLRSHSELGQALRKLTSLETEVHRLRETAVPADAGSYEQMRLIDVEGALVKKAMLRFKGNVSRAAKALGLSRSALYRRLQRHGV
jgi:DNA-binding NtrC family response regulator